MEKVNAFFNSYTDALRSAYDAVLDRAEEDGGEPAGQESALLESASEAAALWETAVQAELGGVSPAQYLDEMNELDTLLKMFKAGAVLCDEDMPRLFTDKLKAFGTEAVDALAAIAGDMDLLNGEELEYLACTDAVKILGEWEAVAVIPRFIKLLETDSLHYDILAQQIKDSLVRMGAAAAGPVLAAIEGGGTRPLALEYLLMAIAEIGRENRSEEIYRCLKHSFLTMESKVIGALCLRSYGDGRAVPALRGFLEKNRGKLEKDDFYEIASVIKALGGSIEGLRP